MAVEVASTSTASRGPASIGGVLLNMMLFVTNTGAALLWAFVTFVIGALSTSHHPGGNAEAIGTVGSLGGIPVLMGLACAVAGFVFALRGDAKKGYWLAAGAFVLGSVPGAILAIFFAGVLGMY